MKYRAKVDLAEFKTGQIVPNDRAEKWMKAYDISPVDMIEEVVTPAAVTPAPVKPIAPIKGKVK